MQFLFSVIDDRTSSGTPQEMAAIRELNLRMRAAGQRVFAGGLAAPETATTIDNRAGQAVVTHGATVTGPRPLDSQAGMPGTAYLSGLWIVEVADEEAALALATEASLACNRRVEVRAFLA